MRVRTLGSALALGVLALGGVVVVRAAVRTTSEERVAPAAPLELDPFALSRRLGRALTHRTVSTLDPASFPHERFDALLAELAESFPRTHELLAPERVGRHAVLYRWEADAPAGAPLLLLAHLDVVPVEKGGDWPYAPFGGELAEGFVWGRGALDDKASALAILEAVEHLTAEGFRPRRDVWIALGFDEEVGGERGAAAVARLLEERGVRPALVLDEGLAVLEDIVDGVERPVAAVGVGEKGSATVRLSAEGPGGHSSLPPPHTAVGRVARAVTRLEARGLPAALDGPSRALFEALVPHMPFGRRLVLANLWLFEPLVLDQLVAAPSTAALVRTTTAATLISGGVKANVLPARAESTVNFRVHPHDGVNAVLAHVREVIDDPTVSVELVAGAEPSPVSPTDGEGFAWLERTIRQVFPDAIVAPSLVTGATDARHYTGCSEAVYRFLPLRLRPDDLPRIHGAAERLALAAYLDMVRFYAQLIRNA
ncbi:MAG: M20 family peptidase [Planctomycetota bacterium]|nr:M20 family peptidase [Planctomycetota bacterium]MDP6988019.1 M20 family peptidase [Planctomycetota bacterium]